MKDKTISMEAVVKIIRFECGELHGISGRIIEKLEALPSAQPGWIPCGEKEPTESGNYLLYRPHFWGAYEGQTTVCYWNGEFWSDDYCSEAERSLPVIEGMFWMPLPAKPWEGGQE